MPQGTNSPVPISGFEQPDALAFVGSFTTAERRAHGRGITVYRVAPASESWCRASEIADLVNPSYLATNPTKQFLYVAHGDADYLTTFSIEPTFGALHFVNRVATGGMNGVHHAIAPMGQYLLVANYADGIIARLPLDNHGIPQTYAERLQLPGAPGPHRNEQIGSHLHQVVFYPSGQFALVPDKGLDRIFVIKLDSPTAALTVADQVVMRPGSGPRHLAFHPTLPIAFVLNELASTLATCAWDVQTGRLSPLYISQTLPRDYFGESTAAAVVVSPCGQFVFTSNRNDDSVALFVFDPTAADIRFVDIVHAGGRTPRFMTLCPDGHSLLVANEGSDSIVIFSIEAPQDGTLRRRPESIIVASPSTVAFL